MRARAGRFRSRRWRSARCSSNRGMAALPNSRVRDGGQPERSRAAATRSGALAVFASPRRSRSPNCRESARQRETPQRSLRKSVRFSQASPISQPIVRADASRREVARRAQRAGAFASTVPICFALGGLDTRTPCCGRLAFPRTRTRDHAARGIALSPARRPAHLAHDVRDLHRRTLPTRLQALAMKRPSISSGAPTTNAHDRRRDAATRSAIDVCSSAQSCSVAAAHRDPGQQADRDTSCARPHSTPHWRTASPMT